MEENSQDSSTETGTAGPNVSYFERIADRTGELLEASFKASENVRRPIIVGAVDPRDGTQAPFSLSAGSENQQPKVDPISPSFFDAFRDRPLRRQGTAKVTRLDSFIALTKRFAAPNSAVFACDDPRGPSLTSLLDYHPEGGEASSTDNCQHRVHYAFPLSDEFVAWSEMNAKPMKIVDFARFLEDHIVDVSSETEPSSEEAKAFIAAVDGKMATPSKLMELSRGLQINEKSAVRDVRNLSTGEAEVAFTSEHVDAAGKPIKIPNLFTICIPLFARSADYYRIIARLRYRKTTEQLFFFYELWRPELVFEKAFLEACEATAKETGLPLFYGAPEIA